MAQTRKRSTSKSDTAKKGGSRAKETKPTSAQRQVAAVLLFVGALLMLCILLVPGGSLWGHLQRFFYGLFGYCAFLVPLLMGYLAVMTAMEKTAGTTGQKLWQSVLLIVMVSAAVHIFAVDQADGWWTAVKTGYTGGGTMNGDSLLGAALGGKDKYTVGGRDYATTCYDSKCVFSKTHKSGSKTYCNMYADAFSKDVLGKLSTVQQNVKDESGAELGVAPDTIIIPNDYALKKAVFEAIGSEKDPGSANNGFNYLFGQWNVIIHPALNFLIPASGAVPFILLDSKYNERNDGNVFQNRVSLEVESHEDKDTKNNVWDAYTRFSGGFVDFRHMIAGGVTGGETL